jgi:hypothetical protein
MSRGPTNGLSSTARRLSPTARLLMGAAATLILFQASRSDAHVHQLSHPCGPCSCSCFRGSMGGPLHRPCSWRSTPPWSSGSRRCRTTTRSCAPCTSTWRASCRWRPRSSDVGARCRHVLLQPYVTPAVQQSRHMIDGYNTASMHVHCSFLLFDRCDCCVSPAARGLISEHARKELLQHGKHFHGSVTCTASTSFTVRSVAWRAAPCLRSVCRWLPPVHVVLVAACSDAAAEEAGRRVSGRQRAPRLRGRRCRLDRRRGGGGDGHLRPAVVPAEGHGLAAERAPPRCSQRVRRDSRAC